MENKIENKNDEQGLQLTFGLVNYILMAAGILPAK